MNTQTDLVFLSKHGYELCPQSTGHTTGANHPTPEAWNERGRLNLSQSQGTNQQLNEFAPRAQMLANP